MAPTRLPSTSSSYLTTITPRVHYTLSSRSLDDDIPSRPLRTKKSIFSAVFGSIASLVVVESLLRNVMGVWNFVHPMHVRNTAIAQHELDKDYIEYHNQEWEDKHKAANLEMVRTMATRKPDMFARNFVLGRGKTSRERKLMAGMLQRYNPEYYQLNQDLLGEVEFQDEDEDGGEDDPVEIEQAVEE